MEVKWVTQQRLVVRDQRLLHASPAPHLRVGLSLSGPFLVSSFPAVRAAAGFKSGAGGREVQTGL